MARRVEHGEPLVLGREVRAPDLDGLALRALLLVRVHDEREEPGLAVALFRLLLVLLDRALVDGAHEVQDVAAERRLAGVDVADKHHVQVVARVRHREVRAGGFLGLLGGLV